MELVKDDQSLEKLNQELNDEVFLENYKKHYDNYKVAFIPKLLGNALVFLGNLFYGYTPSYLKFRSVEIIARVPYYSWASCSFTLMTLFFSDEKAALKYSQVARFASFAQENETMHVVVISHLANIEQPAGFIRYSLIPIIFSFFYFWVSYFLYFINPKYSYQLNYMFENHAYEQYDKFLKNHTESLKSKKIESIFLDWYGRSFENQYDFFQSVRNDELIHRNTSIDQIEKI